MTKLFLIKKFVLVFVLPLLLFTTSCKNDDADPKNIVQTVVDDPKFSILEAALTRASGNLTTVLAGTGPFTVFAPNNDAFIAAGLTESVINNTAPATLNTILTYHVLASKVLASQITAGAVGTVLGDDIYLTTSGGVKINGNVNVTTADLQVSNGVIHEVGKVILPARYTYDPTGTNSGTIEDIVVALSTPTTGAEFTLLKAAIIRANLLGVLDGISRNYTVFAPTDEAFNNAGLTLSVINAYDPTALANVLKYHIVKASAKVYSNNLTAGAVQMLNDSNLTINLTGGVYLDTPAAGNQNATVSTPNVLARNGVIHIINSVLISGE